MLNTHLLNSAMLNAGTEPEPPAHEFLAYRMEVRDYTGALLDYLPAYGRDAKWKRNVNEIESLTFTYPGDSDSVQYLVWPKEIWLRDEYGTLQQRFVVTDASPQRTGHALNYIVSCESIMAYLNDDWIVEYEATDETVGDIIKELFNNRIANTYSIRLGSVDASIAALVRTFTFRGVSIMSALRTIYESVGIGYYYVNPDNRRWYWKVRIGERKGQQIRVGKNLRGVTKHVDTKSLVNRLYLYGTGGGPGNRIDLTDAGHATEYYQKLTYTSRIRAHVAVLKDISDPEVLLEIATNTVNLTYKPLINYTIDCIDTSQSKDFDNLFDRLTLGSTVKVIDEDLGIDSSEIVVGIEQSIGVPSQMVVTLAERARNIGTIIKDLMDRLNALEQMDLSVNTVTQSDATPQAIAEGAGSPGTSDDVSRQDHMHPFDMTPIEDAIDAAVDAVLGDDIAAAIAAEDIPGQIDTAIAALTATENPLPITADTQLGVSTKFSLEDHEHYGIQLVTAASKAELPTEGLDETAVARVTAGSEDGRMYCRNVANDGWDALNFLE